MDIWRASESNLRVTRAFDIPRLEDICFRFQYKQPIVGYTIVPFRAWCRNQGKFVAHFTLISEDQSISFGIITSFTSFADTIQEAVNKLVSEAIDFIIWRSEKFSR